MHIRVKVLWHNFMCIQLYSSRKMKYSLFLTTIFYLMLQISFCCTFSWLCGRERPWHFNSQGILLYTCIRGDAAVIDLHIAKVKLRGRNCPLSPSDIDNNRNEDIGTTAGKCSSVDGICWNLPLALGVARGPAKSPEWGHLLRSRLWPKIINYLMELWLYEASGRMGVGSSRGHLIRHAIPRHLIQPWK